MTELEQLDVGFLCGAVVLLLIWLVVCCVMERVTPTPHDGETSDGSDAWHMCGAVALVLIWLLLWVAFTKGPE